MTKLTLFFTAVFFYLVFFSSFALAIAISDTSASLILDWGSYNVEWNTGNTYVNNGADADLDIVGDHPAYLGGWVADPNVSLTAQVTADAVGTAYTDATSANATAYSRADGIGTTIDPEVVYSTATSHRGRTFSPYSDGDITFDFDYIISQVFSKDLSTEGYSGYSIVELNLSHGTTNVVHEEVVLNNNSGATDNGFLSLTASLLDDEWYYLEGHVYTSAYARSPEQATAPVPEPATLLLLGTGLVGLVGFRKKFRIRKS